MSRRQNRKRKRSVDRRERLRAPFPYDPLPPTPVDIEETFLGLRPAETHVKRTCGGCREFVEDQEVGRGTCLHPASGIFAPWYDTPACDYYRRS